jgi:DNA invertase Pin-like site-specific DNA recombinase
VSISQTIPPALLNRLAVVYVRQSTPHQALTNQESLKLQYGLVDRAAALGWAPDRVRVLDADLGRSGRTTAGRTGFEELVALVNLGQVGVLFAYDVTRLARNCTDWYQLLDLCGYRQCLVGDQDGVYDPATPNGRLILGLKGLIAELELHTLRRRMTDGLLNKARRGDLAQRLPAGLERDALGQVVKDPDAEVRARLGLVFDTFLRLRVMAQVVRFLHCSGLHVPRRELDGGVVWRPATITSVYAILQNPAYAGAFVRGRRRTVARAGQRVVRRLPPAEWDVCVRDKYPAYIDWDTFLRIQAMLRDNHSDYTAKQSRGVPRAGEALLAGLLYCGECGHKMTVHYRSGIYYACHALRQRYRGGHGCQRVGAAAVDAHVAGAFLAALEPAELEAFARARALLAAEAEQVRRASAQQLERLRYRAHLAERQFQRADPDNRLVTAELERRWEQALQEVKAAEEELDRAAAPEESGELSAEERASFAAAGARIAALWEQGQLARGRQKALLRCLVEKVVVRRVGSDELEVRVVWRGGDTSTARVGVAVASWADLSCAAEVEGTIEELARAGKSDAEIAEELTRRGYRSPRREAVSAHMVLRLRLRRRVLRERGGRRSVPGQLTVAEVAERLNVSIFWIYENISRGKIKVARDPRWKRYLFPDSARTVRLLKRLRAGEVPKVVFKGGHQDA